MRPRRDHAGPDLPSQLLVAPDHILDREAGKHLSLYMKSGCSPLEVDAKFLAPPLGHLLVR